MTDEIKQRKLEHITVALEEGIGVSQRAGWGDIHLVHQALPEIDLQEVDTTATFLGRRLACPVVISALTGGHPEAMTINRNLARAAERYGLALGVGSQRAALVNPDLVPTYAVVRDEAPQAFVIANIGAPQLIDQERHPAFTLSQVEQAIAMIQADALAIHMNALQEATQVEGDRRMRGVATALRRLTAEVTVPVIAKETGAGVCREQALLLRSCGVAAIDVGGAGGSSMSALEAARARSHGATQAQQIGLLYRDWGIPTPIALVEAGIAGLPLIATGGVRSGLDVARAIALGATLVGMGFPFLKAASESYERVCELLEQTLTELKIAMQLSGAADLASLRQVDVVVTGETRAWLSLRGFEEELRALANRRVRAATYSVPAVETAPEEHQRPPSVDGHS
ncbi:MAG: type 2 isopentenyl-diphosphate Delta-isomerase [Thermogemmatispora sp.]|jgi:isopentenyl-diphosphate delta-isomerase|uniref:type 2 isopentenyl-diphosphate Delta-isomerase n=1 Tax=Thermogemmatispora sp. TaxID=1968838 RepID=UPI001A1086EA|nr:type 2 isopentenyl-diphosphate Delta-isomerase [Thermogemmatispora sp.]MBE3567296.1 type 2 isopentenyl-diphosphate Delta-isomerase [Thermogemmatispora sp.]